MVKNASEKPTATSSTAAAAAASRRVGVADYFTILGVGKTLIWKHAQKKSAGSTSPAAAVAAAANSNTNNNQNEPTSGGGAAAAAGDHDAAEVVPPPNEVHDEDDAALLERFYREIVDISIVAVPVVMDGTTTTSTLAGTATITTVPNYNPTTTIDHYRNHSGSLDTSTTLSIPPSLSLVTSDVTGTDIPELHGYTILRQTLPAGSAEPPPPRTTPPPQPQKQQHSLPHSPLWFKAQVFDANLDPISGISGEIQAMHVELQQTLEKRAKEAGRQGSSAPILALKDIRRKVQSTLRLRQSGRGNKKTLHGGGGGSSGGGSGTDKFYLGLRRRAPDEGNRPAIANVKLCHVKLHKATCLQQHASMADASAGSSLVNSSLGGGGSTGGGLNTSTPGSVVASTIYQTGSTAAALMGRAALGGAQVVRDRMVGKASPYYSTSSNYLPHAFGGDDHGNASRIVDLGDIPQVPVSEFLDLPHGFEEWSIPEQFKFVRLPPPPPEDDSGDSHAQTLLFPSNDDAMTSASEASGGSGVGVEAVAKLRDHSEHHDDDQDDSPTAQQDRRLKEWKALILPKLVKDITAIAPTSTTDLEEEEFLYIPILAVRRQRVGDEERFHEDVALVDLSVTFCDRTGLAVFPEEATDDEDFDEGRNGTFNLLGKTPWTVAASPISPSQQESEQNMIRYASHGSHSQHEKYRWLGATTILVRRNIPLGFCDAAFATRVLDRFPDRNYKGLPLPEEELPMFCYPTGCRLHRARFSDAPLAQYYGFCVKNERGDSIYVSCVSFMEPLTKAKVEQLAKMSEKRQRVCLPHRLFWERRQRHRSGEGYRDHENVTFDNPNSMALEDDSNFLLTGFDEMTTFENKTICLVSRYPFWTAFRRFLSHLHILSGSSSDLPLERCVSHLLLTVPIPKPGGPCILIPLPTLNAPMILFAPPLKDLPLVDLPFERLMACLDIPTIVTIVLGFLALERKVG
jgi:uncharacterized membrane protein YgcG